MEDLSRLPHERSGPMENLAESRMDETKEDGNICRKPYAQDRTHYHITGKKITEAPGNFEDAMDYKNFAIKISKSEQIQFAR